MPEWGIFTDEGCLERGFRFREDATRHLEKWYVEDDARVCLCCHDHPDEPRDTCEACNEEEA